MKFAISHTFMCVVLILISVNSNYGLTTIGPKICKIPQGDAGRCTYLYKCDPLYYISSNKQRTATEDVFFRQSVASCNSYGWPLKVCCPPKDKWNDIDINPVVYPQSPLFIEQPQVIEPTKFNFTSTGVEEEKPSNSQDHGFDRCGVHSSNSKISGGSSTEIDEYPWLVLLEYEPRKFRCGGSLITNRYVLTAGHCLLGSQGSPNYVRLSEYNITTEPTDTVETDGGGVDTINVTIIAVKSVLPYPDPISDIGLVLMMEPVVFFDFIRPICLPTRDHLQEFTAETQFITAGWGSDGERTTSEVKMYSTLPFVVTGECPSRAVVVEGRYICAGGEQDSCTGDSGGPLMYNTNSTYTIVGIVASGPKMCGSKDNPAMFTYVYKYLDWINENIQE